MTFIFRENADIFSPYTAIFIPNLCQQKCLTNAIGISITDLRGFDFM